MEVLRMLETTERLKHQEDSCFTHASAFSVWLATKTIENNVRKALLLRASEQLPASIDGDGHLSDLHRATIVVVDDEPHVAITLSEILERRDYRTVWFTEPVAALALMEGHRPDLLLTDVNMPILDGFDLAICVKRIYPDCPVLIVSAIGNDPQLAKRIATAGVSVALETKPVQICRLLSRIADLISPEAYGASAESFDSRSLR
jgi:CheY-like chemotaxis protein